MFPDRLVAERALQFGDDIFYALSRLEVIARPHPHVGYFMVLDARPAFDPNRLDELTLAERYMSRQGVVAPRYKEIARGKALVAWREQMDTLTIVSYARDRLQSGDCRYAGAVYGNGVVVSFSGVEARNDHHLSKAVHDFVLLVTEPARDLNIPGVEGPYMP